MAWVDWQFYKTEYRMNMNTAIPESDFPFWEKQARSKINRIHIELVDVPEYLKECTCEVAEYLYQRNEANNPDNIKSFSNDGYSETYVDQSKTQLEEHIGNREIITRHLSGTELHNDFIFTGAQ